MKIENKIYVFFIAAALLFWNPLTFYILYKKTPLITVKGLWFSYIIVFALGFLFILLISKNKLHKRIKNFSLSFAFMGITLGLILCVNASLGTNNSENIVDDGIAFPKNQTIKNQTTEFDYDIITNSIGIRDREIKINKENKFRILCFGDSWTMGFGVNIENSWPRKLQDYFAEKKLDNIEVINCGRGGQYTTTYLEYMKKAVPLLKPNLVLVGVLQLDDLAQLYENDITPETKTQSVPVSDKIKFIIQTIGKYSIGNILKKESAINIKDNNSSSVKNRIAKFDYLQMKQYELLQDSVKYLFESGNLNPGLLSNYVGFTYRRVVFNNPNHPATISAIEKMNKDIAKMKELCNLNNAKMVFINMPTADFTGHKVIRTPDDMFNDFLEVHNHIDSIYRSIALKNDLPYLEMTDHFIDLKEKTKFFYRFDGHPNPLGYKEIANYIGLEIIKSTLIK